MLIEDECSGHPEYYHCNFVNFLRKGKLTQLRLSITKTPYEYVEGIFFRYWRWEEANFNTVILVQRHQSRIFHIGVMTNDQSQPTKFSCRYLNFSQAPLATYRIFGHRPAVENGVVGGR